jgi:general secretion pathway protein H
MTLMETLAVVAITALAATIAFPRVERAGEALSVREETTALTASLRLARAQAIRTGAPVTFSAARDGSGYGWTGSTLRRLHAGIVVAPGGGAAVFYADGSASGGTFALTHEGGTLAFAVDPVTGAVLQVAQ